MEFQQKAPLFQLIVLILFAIIINTLLSSLPLVSAVPMPHHRLELPKLIVFVGIAFTGNEPRDGKDCRAAMQIVVDNANSRRDILGDYYIQAEYNDEGSGMLAPTPLLQFWRSFQDDRNNPEQFFQTEPAAIMSPIATGFYFSPGCRSTSPFLHHIGMAEIATGCLSPLLTANRKKYPNFYRTKMPGELIIYPRLQFVQQVGGWKQLAILTYVDNAFDYASAIAFMEHATRNGVQVPWFDSVYDIDDRVIESLKNSDLRVIVIDIVEISLLFKFFCVSYKFGIRGNRYVFITFSLAYADPMSQELTLVPGCTRAMVIEQLAITFWLGPPQTAIENFGKTPLGYDLAGFEASFDLATNKSRSAEYPRRHSCHDAMLQTILTLNKTEQELFSTYNLTLRDQKKIPDVIIKVANEILSSIDYNGLETGRMKYSQRLELDDQIQIIQNWSPKNSLQVLFKSFRLANTSISNQSNYFLEEKIVYKWTTPDGKPPRDCKKIEVVIDSIPESFFAFSIVASIFTSFVQFFTTICKFQSPRIVLTDFKTITKSEIIFLLSCFVLNACSVTFSINPSEKSICGYRIVLASLGLAMLHWFFLMRLLFLRKIDARLANRMKVDNNFNSESIRKNFRQTKRFGSTLQVPRTIVRGANRQNLSPPDLFMPYSIRVPTFRFSNMTIDDHENPEISVSTSRLCELDGKVVYRTLAAVLLTACISFAWIVSDPPSVTVIPLVRRSHYDLDLDTSFTYFAPACQSSGENIFLGLIIALDIFPLFIAAFLSFSTQFSRRVNGQIPQLTSLRTASLYEITLVMAVICAVLASKASPSAQDIEISTSILFSSLLSSFLVLKK